jgi:hypothetical protein
VGVVADAELVEYALCRLDVAAADLDVAEVAQLDRNHAGVADPTVQRQALGEQLRRPVQVAEHACGLRLRVQRPLPERRLQASSVFAGRPRLRERALVVAVLEGDATQPEVGERERLRVANRLRRRQRRLVPRA